jgi:hypothetical protein
MRTSTSSWEVCNFHNYEQKFTVRVVLYSRHRQKGRTGLLYLSERVSDSPSALQRLGYLRLKRTCVTKGRQPLGSTPPTCPLTSNDVRRCSADCLLEMLLVAVFRLGVLYLRVLFSASSASVE